MDSEDMYSHLRVPSFSCGFVPEFTEEFPLSSSPVMSPKQSPCSNNLERYDKTKPEVCIFGAHISNKNGVCMRCCSIFACGQGTCLEKNADYVNGSADHGGHGMVQSQPVLQNVEQFSFPVLISRIENLKVEKHDNAEITLQGDLQNSVEMFGSEITKELDIAVKLAKKNSRLTWDAIPNTGSRSIIPASSGSSTWCDDTASDNSSDLFDIEIIKPDALSKGQTFVGALDRSLTVSDKEKINPNCVGDMSSTNRAIKQKVSSWIKSGGRWLLGCWSINAVRVEEKEPSHCSIHGNNCLHLPFTSKSSNTASDNSSDLFDIESTKPDALSKGQIFVGALDRSLIVSDKEKINPNCVGDMSSTNRAIKQKVSSWVKSGGRWLLGCWSINAVRVEEKDPSHCSIHGNKCLHLPFTSKSSTELRSYLNM